MYAIQRAIEISLRRPLHVIAYEEVEAAIFVVVNPGGAGGKLAWALEASALGRIGKGAVVVVVVQLERRVLLLVAGEVLAVYQQDVLPAVVVVINECRTRAKR